MAASDKSVAVSSTTDFSSDSTVSDGWQELTKSDYAKVIFSDLLCNAASGTVECKFQITDNVHEDPNDYVGLFRIGYEDLSQCLVSKMLSQTKCEDDGKLQRCVFTANELPCLDDGFYQFLYVTRDQEVCGASMPFEIKMSPFQLNESSPESGSSEKMDAGFLLVSNEVQRKVKEESNEQEETSVQRSALSEQKKEEIAAWVSQNPDYYSLIEQIKEHTFTIDALQQSKDLAMKEVTQLYESLDKQNAELIQLRNMLAAYEEKMKMSQSFQQEKSNEIMQLSNVVTAYEVQMKRECRVRETALLKKTTELNEMKDSLRDCEQKLIMYQLLHNEKDKQLSQMKMDYESSLKASVALQDQQRTEINDLKKQLVEMRESQKAKECHQATGEIGSSLENLVQKAQDFVRIVSGTLKNTDFTDEVEVKKAFQLKIQMLIILSKITRAMDLAKICNRNGMHKIIHSMMEKDAKGNSSVDSTSCALETRGSLLTNSNTNTPEVEKPDIPASPSTEISPSPSSSEKESANEVAPKEVWQRIPFKKMFESEVFEHQINELPRLDVINKDTAMALQADGPLDVEDVTVINRLTEKIIKRGFSIYEAIELVDDSSSDSGSDVSDISDGSSSVKKDLLCVTRVIEALSSSLSNQTSLEQLFVVENAGDFNLICRREWDVLLPKCALHYQIEILLEHIEKQKEGMKKVSDKICELLTKCMLLKDEVRDSKAVCEKLQTVLDTKDIHISKVKDELEFKNSLLHQFCNEKKEWESRAELAERTVEDFHARIMEASDIYKKQYTEIGKLSRKLQKYKSVKSKTNASYGESYSTSSGSSKTSSSFEIVQAGSVQKINDSDTGEHLFEKAALLPNEKRAFYSVACHPSMNRLDLAAPNFQDIFCLPSEKRFTGSEDFQKQIDSTPELNNIPQRCPSPPISSRGVPDFEYTSCNTATEAGGVKHKVIQAQADSNKEVKTLIRNCPDPCLNPLDDLLPSIHESKSEHSTAGATAEKPNTETIKCKSYPTASAYSDYASYKHFQEIIKMYFTNMKKPAASCSLPLTLGNSQEDCISCYFCKESIPLDYEDPSCLMNHFENEHSVKMCPVCGQLFEDAIPPKYFHIHVDQHFETA